MPKKILIITVLRSVIALCSCLMIGDAIAMVTRVAVHDVRWARFHEGYVKPSHRQQIWRYSYVPEGIGRDGEVKTHIYIVVDAELDNGSKPGFRHGHEGAAGYVKRQNLVYDELMQTEVGRNMLAPYFVEPTIDQFIDRAIAQNRPLSRKHFALTNFEESSFKSALKYWVLNHYEESYRNTANALLGGVSSGPEANGFAYTSSPNAVRKNLQIGGDNKSFGPGASASVVISGAERPEIQDIRTSAEEHSHALDMVHGRLASEIRNGQKEIFLNFRVVQDLDLLLLIAEGEAAGWLPRAENRDIHTRALVGEANHDLVMRQILANWTRRGKEITSYNPSNGYAGIPADQLLQALYLHHPANDSVRIVMPEWRDLGKFEAFIRQGGALDDSQYRQMFSDFEDINRYFQYLLENHRAKLTQHNLVEIAQQYRSGARYGKASVWRLYHKDFPNGRLCF